MPASVCRDALQLQPPDDGPRLSPTRRGQLGRVSVCRATVGRLDYGKLSKKIGLPVMESQEPSCVVLFFAFGVVRGSLLTTASQVNPQETPCDTP